MTLLSICQQAARLAGFKAPTAIIGNTDETAVALLAVAQEEGKALARGLIYKTDRLGSRLVAKHTWSALTKEQTFTHDGTATRTLDSSGIVTDNDFDCFLSDTMWDRTNDEPAKIVDASEWQRIKGEPITTGTLTYVVKRGNSLYFDPTPTSGDSWAFEYKSKHWCETSGGTGQTYWQADTDVGVVDENLLELGIAWRFLRNKGAPYFDQKQEYEDAVMAMAADDRPRPTVRLGSKIGQHLDNPNLPETGFGI